MSEAATQPKPPEILRKAKALIDSPKNWCQRAYKQWREDGSCAYCASGAIMEAGGGGRNITAWTYLKRLCDGSPAGYNDSHTHAEVMQKFDEAIALAEAEGQ